MQSQLEGDERWEEVTYFTYAMTIFILREIIIRCSFALVQLVCFEKGLL